MLLKEMSHSGKGVAVRTTATKKGISKWRQWGVVEQVRSKSRLFQLEKSAAQKMLTKLRNQA